MKSKRRVFVMCMVVAFLTRVQLQATMPPLPGGSFPEALLQNLVERPELFSFTSAYKSLTDRVQQGRFDRFDEPNRFQDPNMFEKFMLFFERPTRPFKLSGTKTVPVVMVMFSDTEKEPFLPALFQKTLFDGGGQTPTIADYFKAVSYNTFSMTGKAFGWKKVAGTQTDYSGGASCRGMCSTSSIAKMVDDALRQSAEIDWAPFDNDGPDGKPNSGDDNGFVDFAVFVHPGKGGECPGSTNIWSHQGSLTNWGKPTFQTTTRRPNGGFIRVDDYVVAPAVSCFGTDQMIEIGVYAHEFMHGFGLPDLYSTDKNNPSVGAGNWCLMGTGAWGGDDHSPQRPTHLSAWGKSFVGWLTPEVITKSQPRLALALEAVEAKPSAATAALPKNVRYLLERRDKTGFDADLPAAGLVVWRIDEAALSSGLQNNQVNAVIGKPGIRVIETDGGATLLAGTIPRATSNHVFRGTPGVDRFDSTTKAVAEGGFAICSIAGGGVKVDSGFATVCPLAPAQAGASILGGGIVGAAAAPAAAIITDQQVREEPVSGMNVATLVRQTGELLDQTVSLTARLENAGTNYFTDRRLVLKDPNSSLTVPVVVRGMATEAMPGRAGEPPTLLSDLLAQQVDVVGRLERITSPNGTRSVAFIVESIRVKR